LQIIDLNNVPLICGSSYVKWHLPSSSSAEHRGHTSKALIREHKAVYDYQKTLPVRLTIDRNQVLQVCDVNFEVLQEYSEGGRGGRVLLGNVKINLAEYVDDSGNGSGRGRGGGRSEEGDGIGEYGGGAGIVRRYLMQESKINSTLKIGIKMRQLEGETNFTSPPLKTAMVFGGIAGVLSAEVADGVDETGAHMPSITNKSREMSELHDMYRRTLAASWSCASDELPPDKLIEDLFAGGDGGTMKAPPLIAMSRFSPRSHQASPRQDDETGGESASLSESESKRTVRNQFLTPNLATRGQGLGKGDSKAGEWKSPSAGRNSDVTSPAPSIMSGISGGESIEQQMHLSGPEKSRKGARSVREVSEFDIREDLRSWEIEAR
jgi:N-terminal C2 in EEIG1 and EHBP1 proteins